MVSNLPNGTFYEFPGLAHVTAAGDNCPMLMVQDFLRDPATAPSATAVRHLLTCA